MAEIRDKASFYRLWHAGLLGNRIRIWKNVEELRAEKIYSGTVSIRYKLPSSQYTRYGVPIDEAEQVCIDMAGKDKLNNFTFNESAPDSKLLIQGEVIAFIPEINSAYALHYSTDKLPMRKALNGENGKHANNILGKAIIDHYMNYKSRVMIEELMEEYPNSAIEFGCYSCNLGIYSGYNTIIWEIRNY